MPPNEGIIRIKTCYLVFYLIGHTSLYSLRGFPSTKSLIIIFLQPPGIFQKPLQDTVHRFLKTRL